MTRKQRGSLIIVGGREEKEPDAPREILQEICQHVRKSKKPLLIITVATQHPEEVGGEYTQVFQSLGVNDVDILDIRSREDAYDPTLVEKVGRAGTLFFTGGDQVRITSQMGDSPVYRCMQEIYEQGATIAGTSAGAAAMSETMLISGPGDRSHKISALGMAPGLGLMSQVVIDSHFAERGRFGRLLGAVAQNPKNLGLGIDENTAVVIDKDDVFRVIGTGAVYVFDGTGISFSSVSEEQLEGILSIYDVRLHVLGHGDRYNLAHRRPLGANAAGETPAIET